MRIHKYVVENPITYTKVAPLHRVLSCAIQETTNGPRPVVWVLESVEMVERVELEIYTVNTGAEIGEEWMDRFVGTVTSDAGIVWHVFARRIG